jgi:hypothetical protein
MGIPDGQILRRMHMLRVLWTFAVIVILSTCGCARYYTRLFLLDEGWRPGTSVDFGRYGVKCGDFLVHPNIGAYGNTTGFHERYPQPLEDYRVFGISVDIDHPAENVPLGADHRIRNIFHIDSLMIEFLSTGEIKRYELEKIVLRRQFGSVPYGVSFFFGADTIPEGVDSLLVIVRTNIPDSLHIEYPCDTLMFQMHLFESKKTDLWLP